VAVISACCVTYGRHAACVFLLLYLKHPSSMLLLHLEHHIIHTFIRRVCVMNDDDAEGSFQGQMIHYRR
jgi:hypothetical protein